MPIRNEITIGPNPLLNNLVMYRKVDNVPFSPQYTFINDNQLDVGSNIQVNYIQYYKNAENNQTLIEPRFYIIPNIEGWNAANDWFMLLARTPQTPEQWQEFQTKFIGIIDAIEATLAGLPMDVANGYHLQQPL